jgi:D-aminopeptidase
LPKSRITCNAITMNAIMTQRYEPATFFILFALLFTVSCKKSPEKIIAKERTTIVSLDSNEERKRARDYGIAPGILATGLNNAITDVAGVQVGHQTLIRHDSIRTGVTVILPHPGNIFKEKVPAAVYVGNGFGKAIGFTQVMELGNLETPIALTNTLNAFTVANALIDYTLLQPGNESLRSVNPVVGETNDGYLNDIQRRHVDRSDVFQALEKAGSGPVPEGNVGAGTGTQCLGYKGGIGTASRVVPETKGGYTVGVLVQTNFGGVLTINGAPIGEALGNHYLVSEMPQAADGSCMMVIATDAPLSPRNLERLAKRSFLALGKVGAFASNGSGDYSIAFSTHPKNSVAYEPTDRETERVEMNNDHLSPLFMAVVEATEEAIYNSMFKAEDMTGRQGRTVYALPIEAALEVIDRHKARH